MTVPALGAVFLPYLAPEQLRSVAVAADEAGLDELWLWEDCFRESGIAAAAAALAWTDRLRVGVGLLPVPLRNVALTAMETATICRLFPGRFELGIGHGVQEWMAQVGAQVESPLTLLREYAVALRSLLAGETVTTQGRYVRLDAVRLDWPPDVPPRLLAGAIGPRSLAVCGEVADATIVSGGTPPARVAEIRTIVEHAAAAAGKVGAHPLTVYVLAATGPGCEDRLRAEIVRSSLDPAEEVGVAGDATAVAAAVRRWVAAGAATVVLQPTPDDPDPEGFVRFVAREVRAALARPA